MPLLLGLDLGTTNIKAVVIDETGKVLVETSHGMLLLDSGVEMKRLLICGKAGASDITPQILAGIIGGPISCITYCGASALGAAILAVGLIQQNRKLDEISNDMAASSRMICPGENQNIYAEVIQEYISSLPKVT